MMTKLYEKKACLFEKDYQVPYVRPFFASNIEEVVVQWEIKISWTY